MRTGSKTFTNNVKLTVLFNNDGEAVTACYYWQDLKRPISALDVPKIKQSHIDDCRRDSEKDLGLLSHIHTNVDFGLTEEELKSKGCVIEHDCCGNGCNSCDCCSDKPSS